MLGESIIHVPERKISHPLCAPGSASQGQGEKGENNSLSVFSLLFLLVYRDGDENTLATRRDGGLGM
jgi:hypothetical protein